jgi:hypothetical protein
VKRIGWALFALFVLIGGSVSLFHQALFTKNFRSSSQFLKTAAEDINQTGLDTLRISGSKRIAFPHLKWLIKDVKGPFYIVDLTGDRIKYYKGLTAYLFKPEQQNPDLISLLRRYLIAGSRVIDPADIKTEAEMAQRFGLYYQGFSIRRQGIPRKDVVDKLVEFFMQLPKDAWLHLHCDAGKGRTTTVMAMIDILKNGRDIPLEDIIKRQHVMGGVDLFDTALWANGTYTVERLQTRKNFIISFYDYVNDPKGYGVQKWSEWCYGKEIEY